MVRELKDDMEAKESDRRKAIKRLQSKKEEIKLLNERLYEVRDDEQGGSSCRGGLVEGEHQGQTLRGYFVSLSFLICVLAVMVFHTYVPGGSVLEWKVVMSTLSVVCSLYRAMSGKAFRLLCHRLTKLWFPIPCLTGVAFPIVWMYLGSLSSSDTDGGNGGGGGMASAGETLRTNVMVSSMWWLIGFLGGVCVARLE